MRVVLFICAQSYLCALNVVYSEVPNKRSGLLIIFGKFDPPHQRLLLSKILQVLCKKIYIYISISHRCSLANSLRVFRTPSNSGGMFLYLNYNVYFDKQL